MKKLILIIALLAIVITISGCMQPTYLCGNGICDQRENHDSCPEDCQARPAQNLTETHMECQSQACVEVQGQGTNQCTMDADCQTLLSIETHFECQDQACVEVQGPGTNQCQEHADCLGSPTETHMECQDQACVEVQGPGANQCQEDIDCLDLLTETHMECQSQLCLEVQGPGANQCQEDIDCLGPAIETHWECQDQACVEVQGPGIDQCVEDVDCLGPPAETHWECQSQACVEVQGPGADQCEQDVDCQDPPADNLPDIFSVDLTPILIENASLEQDLPIGQIFNLIVFMQYFGENEPHQIYSVEVETLLNETVIAETVMRCEKNFESFICSRGIWSAVNVPSGEQTYKFRVTTKDEAGNELFTKVEDTSLSFRPVIESPCKEVIPGYNDSGKDRLNLVFVGFGYDNVTGKTPQQALNLLAKTVIDFEDQNYGLFSVSPFKGNEEKFNFWQVDILGSVDDCNEPGSSWCDTAVTFAIAERCPFANKYILSFVDADEDTGASERLVQVSAKLSGQGSTISENTPMAFVHEFAHSFGNLIDEYVLFPEKEAEYETPVSIFDRQNCYAGPQHTIQECLQNAPWKDLIGDGCGEDGVIDCIEEEPDSYFEVGCFEGCGKVGKGIFRATRKSIMASSSDKEYYQFGLWNETLLGTELNKVSGN